MQFWRITLAVLVVVFIGITLFFSLQSRDITSKSGRVEQAPGARSSTEPTCGTVTAQCEVTANLARCDSEETRMELSKMLARPLNLAGCQHLERDLSASCPYGCSADLKTALVVPGKVIFEFNVSDNAGATCQSFGRKVVKMQAQCFPKDH